MLEYTTLSPGSVTAADITEWYSEFSYKKPLTLWHKNTKLNDDRLVGKMKGLVMKEAEDKEPAHHQLCSPGKTPEVPAFLTPREAYEVGMRSTPTWTGK